MPRELWDAPYRLLEGPNQWPDDTVPELRSLVEQWAELLSTIGVELTRAIAVALGLPEDHFDQYFAGQPHWFGKLIHYVGAADGADLQGVGPHTDWNFLTLLLQDDAGGLQARPAGADRWIDVPPIDGALIVNIGEMLEVATHGYLVATPHRVLPCAPGGTRDSIAFFWAPRLDACLDTVPLPHEYAEQAPESASPRTTSCTAASGTTRSRAGCARTPRSRRPTMPTCSSSRIRLTDHREAIPFSAIVDVDLPPRGHTKFVVRRHGRKRRGHGSTVRSYPPGQKGDPSSSPEA